MFQFYLFQPQADDLTKLIIVQGHHHRWLAGGYDLAIGHFRGG